MLNSEKTLDDKTFGEKIPDRVIKLLENMVELLEVIENDKKQFIDEECIMCIPFNILRSKFCDISHNTIDNLKK